MNKQKLLEVLIEQLERKSAEVNRLFESARQDVIAAEGRMQTRYGSEKEESGYVADGLNQRKLGLMNGLVALRNFVPPGQNGHITHGSLVKVKDSFEELNYFILPYGGGETLNVENNEIFVVSPDAPIAKSLIGRQKGNSFNFGSGARAQQYTILEVA